MWWFLGMLAALAGGPEVEIVTDKVTVAPEMDYAMRSVMREIYRAYDETLGLPMTAPPKVVIHVTSDEAAVRAAYTGTVENIAGFYSYRTQEAWVWVQPHSRHPERTLFHEVSHRLLHASTGRALPPWLNEGLAEVFEQSYVMGRSLASRPSTDHDRRLRAAMAQGELPTLKSIVSRNSEAWWAAQKIDTPMAYATSWAAVAFLLSTDEGRTRLRRVLKVADARDTSALLRVLGDWPGGWQALEGLWRQWMASPKQDVLLASAPKTTQASDGPRFVRCADASFVLEGTPCP